MVACKTAQAEGAMLNVLSVDDDAIIQFDLCHLLEPLARTSTAASGGEAVAKVDEALRRGERFQCIFMDITMPGQDGLTTVSQLVELFNTRRIPMAERPKIVMLSSDSERDTQIDALYACGADYFLVKPLDEPALIAALDELGLVAQA